MQANPGAGAGGSLVSALAAVSPPPNPGTQNVRTDPEMTTILDYQRIRASVQRALDNAADPFITQALHAMHGTAMQLLLGMDGQSVLQYLQHAVGGSQASAAPPAPVAPAPGGPPAAVPAPQGF
jgi:hypothetical protein